MNDLHSKVIAAMLEAAAQRGDRERVAYYEEADAAIAIVLEEAAQVVWRMRRDPLTTQGDHHGKAGEWMRAALDDAEDAIRALKGAPNVQQT